MVADPPADLPVAFPLVAPSDADPIGRSLKDDETRGMLLRVVIPVASHLPDKPPAEVRADADRLPWVFSGIEAIDGLIPDDGRRLVTVIVRRREAGRRRRSTWAFETGS